MAGWKHEGSRHKRGYGWRWEKLRKVILTRDSYLCQRCKEAGRLTTARHVDHITPKAQGGDDSPDNLQSLCVPCHKAKTSHEVRGTVPSGCDVNGIPLDPNHYWR